MCRKKINKIIAITSVVGAIVSIKALPVYATENNNGISVASLNKGQVINVSSTSLRIRKSPSTTSDILGSMKNGSTFDIISKTGKWYEISYNGLKGFVYGDYVKELSQTTTPTIIKSGKVYNVSSSLRVRSGSSINSSIIGYLTNNSAVSIVDTTGEWYRIKFGSSYGYVHKDYILVDGSSNNSNNSPDNENNNTSGDIVIKNKKGIVYNIGNSSLRVRKGPSTNADIVGSVYEGNTVEVIGESGSFYKINYKNTTAYVHKNYIKLVENNNSSNDNSGTSNSDKNESDSEDKVQESMDKKGQVINITSNLRVRKKPSTDGMVLGYLLNNQYVDIIGKEGDWYKIIFNGSVGYVSGSYIKIVDKNNGDTSVSDSYSIILSEMKKQIGAPYTWGGSGEIITEQSVRSLKERFPQQALEGKYDYTESYIGKNVRAFDCSGLMQWGFARAGIKIGRTTYDQIKNGVEVSINNVKPGDLLFRDKLSHVGMYIGDGKWIESPSTGKNVRIVNVPWNYITRARRVL